MDNDIPKVHYDETTSHNIEVINFHQLLSRLNKSRSHDPFELHRIEFYLILVVSKNSYTHILDFKSFDLEKGSALFIAKNQVHQFNKGLKDAEGICIIFNSVFLEKYRFIFDNRLFNYHIDTPVVHQSEMGSDNIIETANRLYEEFIFPNEIAKSEILRALLQVLLLKAERAKELQSNQASNVRWLEVFSSFRVLLETDYIKTRNARAYASELFISYKFLNDVVRKLAGKTAKAFIDEFVVMEIKRYLASTSLSIKEISYKTGFEESANMIKFFRKHTDNTPLKFRQQL